MTKTTVKFMLDGHVDDLYALSLLFSAGAHPDLHVVTQITGAKDGLLDRVQNADHRETYLTGDHCLWVFEARPLVEKRWAAMEILAPLNGYADRRVRR
jgi:hypothetical protein